MDYAALIAALGGAVGVLLTKAVDWYNLWRNAKSVDKRQDDEHDLKEDKQKAEISIPINEQAVQIYGKLVESLRADMDKMLTNMRSQDGLLLTCREEKLTLKAEKLAALAEKELAQKALASALERLNSLEDRMTKQEHNNEPTV
jgi:hypothetical protein